MVQHFYFNSSTATREIIISCRIKFIILFFIYFYFYNHKKFCFYFNFQYNLTLVASDSLNENHTTIIINVKDVNDMPPVFLETLYEETLNEELEAPYNMLQVVLI